LLKNKNKGATNGLAEPTHHRLPYYLIFFFSTFTSVLFKNKEIFYVKAKFVATRISFRLHFGL